MENNQKWVNLSYVAAALLVAFLVVVIANKFSVLFDIEGRVHSLDKILLGVGAVVGLIVFVALYNSGKANTFMGEVVAELGKVSWPTQNETMKATVAVLIAVVIAGFLLWLVDAVWVVLLGLVM